MRKPKYVLSIFVLLIFSGKCLSQKSKDAVPLSYNNHLASITFYEKMIPVDGAFLKKIDEYNESQGIKAMRFAKMIPVHFSPENSGTWEYTGDGKIWRLGIISSGAYSMYLIFGIFQVANKVNLFVYTPGYKEFRGAFTKNNNNIRQVLSIAPLPSDTMIIEMDIPNEQADYGNLVLTQVGHDYRNVFGWNRNQVESNPTPVGTCYVDINCPDGEDWQLEKKGVCKIIIGDELCTGSLIANLVKDKTPYFMTAGHCTTDTSNIPGSIFFFNYEKTYCDSILINPGQTLSGASGVASTPYTIDFNLLKMNDLPPATYHPYFLGWDWSGVQPLSGTIIHHPNGAVKKISFDYQALVQANQNLFDGFDTADFWEVTHYDVGATEPGSSGGPLFDSHHHVVGFLSGGPASCINPGGGDYYTKFALAWDSLPNPRSQLKAWLDPENSGLSSMDGYDPYLFNVSNCDTAWNIENNESLDLHQPSFLWSKNYPSNTITDVAEKYYTPAWLDLFGIFLNVDQIFASQPLSIITLKVWNGDSLPANVIYTQDVFLKNIHSGLINFIAFDSVVNVSGNFFIGYSKSSSDSFGLYHALNRGLNGPSTVYVNNGTWQPIDAVTSPSIYTSLGIGLYACNGKVQLAKSQPIKIYPNPCTNVLYIQPADGITLTGLTCYDITGKQVPIRYTASLSTTMATFNLPPGMYFLKVNTVSASVILRFIVIHQ